MVQDEIVRANAIQADFYRELYKNLTSIDSDDLRHELYNAESALVNAIDRYHHSIDIDFRTQIRVLTTAEKNAKGELEIKDDNKEKFSTAPRKFIPLINRDYNGVLAPQASQNQTQFSDHRHGQKITSFLHFVW